MTPLRIAGSAITSPSNRDASFNGPGAINFTPIGVGVEVGTGVDHVGGQVTLSYPPLLVPMGARGCVGKNQEVFYFELICNLFCKLFCKLFLSL